MYVKDKFGFARDSATDLRQQFEQERWEVEDLRQRLEAFEQEKTM